MHKIDGAGHLNNMFVMEDALLNRPPTEITADFMNALQVEICNVIEWAGIGLNKADNGQLLQALQASFASLDPGGSYATKLAVQVDDYKIAEADVIGSADAIVATFFPVVTALASAHGMVLYVRCLAANASATPTFTPNNGVIAGKTIVKGNNLPLVAGDIAGAGYWAELRYDLTIDKWVLLNPATGLVPIVEQVLPGSVMHFAMPTAPAGWLKANGAAVSRTSYAALFAAIGTTFGVGDGASTFGLPDLRGEFIRGFDDGRGVDSGRGIGTAQSQEIQSHNHSIFGFFGFAGGGGSTGVHAAFSGANTGASGGAETRPRNIALLACIKF